MKCKKIEIPAQCVRIEDPRTGHGVWRSEDEHGDYIVDNLSTYNDFSLRHCNFPTMYAEFYSSKWIGHDLKLLDEHFCAFKSIEQLQKWVTKEELKELIELGFKVYLIETSECLEGRYQIAFRKEAIIEKKDISQLFR